MENKLFEKFKNSVDVKDKKIYLSNKRLIDFDGVLIGFFDVDIDDTKINEKYLSPYDFDDLDDFKQKLNEFLKELK